MMSSSQQQRGVMPATGDGQWVGRAGLLVALALSGWLAGCSNEAPTWALGSDTSLDDLSEQFPEAAHLIDAAGQTPIEGVPEGLRIHRRAATGPMGSGWQSVVRGLEVTVSTDAPGSYRVAVPDKAQRVDVHREGWDEALATVEQHEHHVVARARAADAFFFATPLGVEELLLVHDPAKPVGYELNLPAGWSLRRARGHRPIVEVLDERGVPWARMVAERAWDSSGKELAVELFVAGSTVELSLPSEPQGPALVDPEWQDAGSFSDSRAWATATLLANGQVLVAGGMELANSDSYCNASADLFDPVTGTFSPTDSMTAPRQEHTATLLSNGLVLVAGGMDRSWSGPTSTAELYDVTTGEFRPTSSMSQARNAHTATLLHDGRVLVAGGTADAGGNTVSAELFDPLDETFAAAGPLQVNRSRHFATLLPDGRVLIAGGRGDESAEALASAELFDPGQETFSLTDELAQGRVDATAVLLGETGPVLVAGGHPQEHWAPLNPFDSVELYDSDSETFSSQVGLELPEPMALSAGSLLPEGDLLVAGAGTGGIYAAARYGAATGAFSPFEPWGELSGGATCGTPITTNLPRGRLLVACWNAAFVYDLSEPSFEQPEPVSMAEPRVQHTATRLPDGRVLVVGGGAGDAQIYDAEQDQFAAVAGLPFVDRIAHTATALPSGEVLVTGGLSGTDVLSSAVLFEPSSEQFRTTDGELSSARHYHSATLLADGTVLLTGGFARNDIFDCDAALASAELYDPETNRFSPVGSLSSARWGHTSTLLPNGQVLVMGGRGDCDFPATAASAELYDPSSGQFIDRQSVVPFGLADHNAIVTPDTTVLLVGQNQSGYVVYDWRTGDFIVHGTMDEHLPRHTSTATLLPQGDVLFAGGIVDIQHQYGATTSVVRYDTSTRAVADELDMTVAREGHTATLLRDGRVLLLGGFTTLGANPTASAEMWRGADVAEERRPVITSYPASAAPGDLVLLEGTRLVGASEGSGGPRPSPTNLPVAVWLPHEGPPSFGTVVDRSTTAIAWRVPATSYPGPGLLFVVVNGIYSKGVAVTLTQAPVGLSCLGDGACASGFCTDGVCCDQRCDEPCYACSAAKKVSGADGECGPVPAGSEDDGACPQQEQHTCGRTGVCAEGGTCKLYPDGTYCGDGLACYDERCQESWCDGDHMIVGPSTYKDCTPYLCSVATDDCLESCDSSLDCAAGYVCSANGRCASAKGDRHPSCSPACAIGARRGNGNQAWFALALGAGLWTAHRCRRRGARPRASALRRALP